MKTWRLGTRSSLLALTQSQIVQKEFEKKTGQPCQLIPFTTEGDQKTDKALWELEGKDFFTKELDQALLSHQVDFVVHSYKDLGTDRPEGIQLAAVPLRNFPHDILLIKQSTIEKPPKKLVIGTSSPRRQYLLDQSLKDFLPFPAELNFKVLRGNINTRIQKLQDNQYDAIVLALAGLDRLAQIKKSSDVLQQLLQDLNFMILPLSHFPCAPAQGALAIECRADDPETLRLLQDLHHLPTAQQALTEKQVLQQYGGGCHLAVGSFCFHFEGHQFHMLKGQVDKKPQEFWKKTDSDFSSKHKIFFKDELSLKKPLAVQAQKTSPCFVTSRHCLHAVPPEDSPALFAAGSRTAKALAKQGYWVRAMGGFEGSRQLEQLQSSAFFTLFPGLSGTWQVLSHAHSNSELGQILPVYTRKVQHPTAEFEQNLKKNDGFYWTSFSQYQDFLCLFPWLAHHSKKHYCGLGKTFRTFQENKVKVTPLPMTFFKKWTNAHG